MDLVSTAKTVFQEQGWRIHDAEALSSVSLNFDLAAESESALAFLKVTSGSQLGEIANRLAGEIASITLVGAPRAKAWEAYLILFLSDGYEEHLAEVQALQYDFTFCRRVVLDLAEMAETDDPRAKLTSDLAFLFPLGLPTAPSITDVRRLLADKLAGRGAPLDLAQALVTHFDDATCACLQSIAEREDRGSTT